MLRCLPSWTSAGVPIPLMFLQATCLLSFHAFILSSGARVQRVLTHFRCRGSARTTGFFLLPTWFLSSWHIWRKGARMAPFWFRSGHRSGGGLGWHQMEIGLLTLCWIGVMCGYPWAVFSMWASRQLLYRWKPDQQSDCFAPLLLQEVSFEVERYSVLAAEIFRGSS